MLQYYRLRPLGKLGCEVLDLDLSGHITRATIEHLKQDVEEFKLLIFRYQNKLSPKKLVEIAKWFGNGKLKTTFCNHNKSPSLDILRMSNDEGEGCTHNSRRGWNIDGSFMPEPFSHSLYHLIKVPKQSKEIGTAGTHSFVDLTAVLNSSGLSKNQLRLWNRLWMVSDSLTESIHPLIYEHPTSKQEVMCFHLGMIDSFILDYGSNEAKQLTDAETRDILQQIQEAISKSPVYHHKAKIGDFIIADNLAVANTTSPESHQHPDLVGLSIVHRATVAGTTRPCKNLPITYSTAIEAGMVNYKLFELAKIYSEYKDALPKGDSKAALEYNFIRSAG